MAGEGSATYLRMMKSSLALCALAAAVLAGGSCTPAARPPAPAATVRFLSVNDIYVLDTLRDGTGGLARVAALRDSLERAGGDRMPLILAGDFLSPSLLSKWYNGRQMIDAMNAARFDYATFGNHEFELDRDSLVARVRDSHFRWISSNCFEASGQSFPNVPQWDTVSIGGTKVGLFALTIRLEYRRYVKCVTPDSAAHVAVAALKAAGAQVVVGITHQFLAQDSALLAREPSIDAILGGHEHEFHLVRQGTRLVAKADANSRSAQLVTLSRESGVWRDTSALIPLGRGRAFDPLTARVARAWRDTLVRRLGPERALARSAQPIDGRDAISRWEEGQLGDIVTDAMRTGTNADVAIINSGTLRLDDVIAPGPITNYTIESIFLFADETRVVTFPLTGARLRELLEYSVSDVALGHGGFLQVSGISFHYQRGRPSGARIVGDVVRTSGAPITAGETLRVSFDIYPACDGGDGYKVPEAAPACQQKMTAPRTVDLLAIYLEKTLGGTISVPPTARILKQ
ncbi:MAG: 5'-nucleotidase C-terminal domain-containing protein [Gemmatimonadota bacterium]|nr:5'-nucleotidase C-terminal domain-containing protein [Gemmatimonadota bacterium]